MLHSAELPLPAETQYVRGSGLRGFQRSVKSSEISSDWSLGRPLTMMDLV